MDVDGKHYRTIWLKENESNVVQIIDQRSLPHRFVIEDLTTVDEVACAITVSTDVIGCPERGGPRSDSHEILNICR